MPSAASKEGRVKKNRRSLDKICNFDIQGTIKKARVSTVQLKVIGKASPETPKLRFRSSLLRAGHHPKKNAELINIFCELFCITH